MRRTSYPVYDADNHLYEPEEAFSRHLPARFKRDFYFVDVEGRRKLVIAGMLSEYIPNPTFAVVAAPGSHVKWYRAENPESNDAAGVGYGGRGGGGGRTGGRAADPARVLEGIRAREQLLQNMAAAMAEAKVTALAYKAVEHQPTLIEEATTPPYKSNGGVVSLNTFLIHTPTITIPMGFTSDGIPAGVAFLGLPFSDAELIKLAYAYEQATQHRKPPASTPSLVAKIVAPRPGTAPVSNPRNFAEEDVRYLLLQAYLGKRPHAERNR